jgi:hypothetical protein
MKAPTQPQPSSNCLDVLIRESTKAPSKNLIQIEHFMQDEVFQSTLDWKAREQLAAGARLALARLNENREWYILDQACRVAMFHKMHAESVLRNQNTRSNRAAFAEAERRYEALRDNLLVRLDEPTSTD